MLVQVLKSSLKLLKREPKVFAPRMLTTALYTFFTIYSAKLSFEIINALTKEMLAAEALGAAPRIERALAGYESALTAYLLFFLFIYAVDVLSYGMYVRIVRDYRAGAEISLRAALGDAMSSAKTLFVLSLVVLAFLGIFLLVYSILGVAYMQTQSAIFPVLALLLLLLAIALFALLFFFLLPAAVAEKRGAASALSRSVALGMRYRSEALKTNFVFVALVLVTMLVAMATEFKGTLTYGAIALFIAGRLVQMVVYTYISAVNPAVFFGLEEEKGRKE